MKCEIAIHVQTFIRSSEPTLLEQITALAKDWTPSILSKQWLASSLVAIRSTSVSSKTLIMLMTYSIEVSSFWLIHIVMFDVTASAISSRWRLIWVHSATSTFFCAAALAIFSISLRTYEFQEYSTVQYFNYD